MSRKCMVTGKKRRTGHNVSHANNKTLREFLPNLQTKRLWWPEGNRYVKLRLSAKGLRYIDKKGVDTVLQELRKQGVAF